MAHELPFEKHLLYCMLYEFQKTNLRQQHERRGSERIGI